MSIVVSLWAVSSWWLRGKGGHRFGGLSRRLCIMCSMLRINRVRRFFKESKIK